MKKIGRAVPALRNGQTSLSNELPAFIQIIEESNKSHTRRRDEVAQKRRRRRRREGRRRRRRRDEEMFCMNCRIMYQTIS